MRALVFRERRMPLLASSLVVLVVVVVGVLFVGSASAARGHVFERAFGSEGSGAGQLKEPVGVAVNKASAGLWRGCACR